VAEPLLYRQLEERLRREALLVPLFDEQIR
jgi:hypothetical protein